MTTATGAPSLTQQRVDRTAQRMAVLLRKGLGDDAAYRKALDAEWRDAGRTDYRAGLFQRRGLGEPQAVALAERLEARDFERDDRRCCIECQSFQRGGTCHRFPSGEAWAKPDARAAVIPALLQRCHLFAFQTP